MIAVNMERVCIFTCIVDSQQIKSVMAIQSGDSASVMGSLYGVDNSEEYFI